MRARYRSIYLLIVMLLVCSLAAVAQGGGAITNGQMLAGSVTSTTPQNWTFTAASGLHVCASVDYSASVNNYQVLLTIDGQPSSGLQQDCLTLSTSGTHQISVATNAAGAPATAYTLGLYISRAPYAASQPGGSIIDATAYTSMTDGPLLNLWSFLGTAGDNVTLTIAQDQTLTGYIQIFKPDGSFFKGGVSSSQQSFTLPTTGTYLVFTGPIGGANPGTQDSFGFGLTGLSASGDAKADGAFCLACSLGGAAAGDPINVATGGLFEQFVDYTSAGANPLAFIRSYNSLSQQHGVAATTLGPNWRSNFDRYLHVASPYIQAERADGRMIGFHQSGTTWVPDTDVDYSLTVSGSTYTLKDPSDTSETYTVTGSLGLPQTIALRNGYVQTLNYTGSTLNGVTDSYGRHLSFSYTNGLLSGIDTHDTLQLAYGYPASGPAVLTSVGYNTSPATSQTYLYENSSLPLFLTGVTDENQHRYATWAYDTYGRATSSEHFSDSGATQAVELNSVAYNDTDGSRIVTNPLGVQYTYQFSLLQGVSKVSSIKRHDPAGTFTDATVTRGYDSAGYLNAQTDWNGTSTTYTNNAYGLPTQIVEAVGKPVQRTTNISYDPTWRHELGSVSVVGSGLSTTYGYQPTYGTLLSKQLTDSSSVAGTYTAATRTWNYKFGTTTDDFGLLLTVQNPRTDLTIPQRTTTFTYTAGGLASISNGLGQTTTINTRTVGGRPLTMHDPNGVLTTMTYDQRQQRLLTSSVTTVGGVRTTTYGYDSAGNLTSTKLPDNSTITNTLDAAYRLIAATDSLSNNANYTLDALGDVTAVNYKNTGGSTKFQHSDSFDNLGRVLVDTKGTNRTTTYTYDQNGNTLTIVDPDGHPQTTKVFDALNRVSQVTDPAGGVTKYTYDAYNRPLTVVAPLTTSTTATTTYTYDGFGDLVIQASPDSGTTKFYFDQNSNLKQKTDAVGTVATFTNDAIDRRTGISYPVTSENVAYFYDQTTGHTFGIGRLTSMTDQAGSENRSYDERGNLTSAARKHGSSVTLTTGYGYDAAGRIASITYPDGTAVAQAHDARGYISGLTLTPSGAAAQTVVQTVKYQPFGPDTTLTYGNGIAETRSYDADYRRTGVFETATAGSIINQSYGLDGNGNLTGVTDRVTPNNSQTLTYDYLDRVLTAATTSGGYGSESWNYDSSGNRTTVNGVTWGYTANTNRLTSIGGITVTPNVNGNITNIAYATNPMGFTYNNANRLASVTVGGSTMLTALYDGLGNRVTKTDTATRFLQYGQDGALLATTDNLGSTARDYIYLNGRAIAIFTPSGTTGTLYFLHGDRVGQPLVATTSTQAIGWSNANVDPFGAGTPTTTSVANELRFPGQENELGLTTFNLNHNGFRDYAPGLGRYLETDPIGLAGGVNTYAYAGNSPGRFTDRAGLDDQSLVNTGGKPIFLPQSSPASTNDSTDPDIGRMSTPTRIGGASYPPNNGAVPGTEKSVTLQPGDEIDRYGGESRSQYFSPRGTSACARSMPPETANQPLNTYRVVNPIPATQSTVAPANEQPGGGTQFRTDDTLGNMLKSGDLEPFDPTELMGEAAGDLL